MSKINCPSCQKLIKQKTIPYHVCQSSITPQLTKNAWCGDALHRLHVVEFLSSIGYNSNISHSIGASYLSSAHQSSYMRHFRLLHSSELSYNEHKQAQIFEALYYTSEAFRSDYRARFLTSEEGLFVVTVLSRESFESCGLVLPKVPVIFPGQRSFTSFELLQFFRFFLRSFVPFLVRSQ
jgi:hypothetical protein